MEHLDQLLARAMTNSGVPLLDQSDLHDTVPDVPLQQDMSGPVLDDDGFIFSTACVDYGYYETVRDLIAAVNKALVKETGNRNITVSFDPRTAKVKIVGDMSSHLLRTIPVNGKSGDVIAKTFTNIQYVPVQTKSFEDVEILLRDDIGYPVPFERGKVIATLRSMPLIKTGAKALGKIALKSGADFLGDVLSGKNVKEAAKARAVEAAHVAKRKAINKVMGQTGIGKRAKRSGSVK
ncbi:Hypothetical predicted protein [Paramuricea clavata]|uniref:Uncharacterized protein n=1 Tax=Paramuricea clavata TaxID=317549 RepID=A0A6S7IY47_PARCT|nr:Hypothetical predicted protein [Paramuricea clavata]